MYSQKYIFQINVKDQKKLVFENKKKIKNSFSGTGGDDHQFFFLCGLMGRRQNVKPRWRATGFPLPKKLFGYCNSVALITARYCPVLPGTARRFKTHCPEYIY
jgi:hypothetical protein